MARGGDNRAKNKQITGGGKGYTLLHKIPTPPPFLNTTSKKIFREHCDELIKVGRLQKVDIPLLADYCHKIELHNRLAEEIKDEELVYETSNGSQAPNAKLKIMEQLSKEIKIIGDRFYFNPRERYKNKIGGASVVNKSDPAMKFLKKAE